VEGLGVYDLGVFPELKANFSVLWGLENLGVGYNLRWIGSIDECRNNNCRKTEGKNYNAEHIDTWSDGHFRRSVGSNVTMDIFVSYSLEHDFGVTKITGGINNFLDQDPAVVFNGFLAGSDSSTYDYRGRFFYARITQTF
jgi:outer membrane receptor protein involved in Fe transport